MSGTTGHACVGFLGTWWTGLIAGWLAARLKWRWWGMAVPMACAALAGVAADAWARSGGSFVAWRDLAEDRGAVDIPAFLRVCAIHTAGYLGAVIGLVMMIISRVFPPCADLNAT